MDGWERFGSKISSARLLTGWREAVSRVTPTSAQVPDTEGWMEDWQSALSYYGALKN